MTVAIIIIITSLLLTSYLFDLTSSITKVPSVILLLLLGYSFNQCLSLLNVQTIDLSPILPIFGTIGLILIVLEGSLELEINKTKLKLISTSFLVAFIPIIIIGILLAYLFQTIGGFSFKTSLINAIPLCIISSAIAIPSVKNLVSSKREFVTYESSFSDIIGIIAFNFFALNSDIEVMSFVQFFFQLVIIIIISLFSTFGLAFLLGKSNHHVKFVPIILIIILIYAVSKYFHLPSLIFILFFGLFIGNFNKFKNTSLTRKLEPDKLISEVQKFKEILYESTFIIRSLFFILFGFLLETKEIINSKSIIWSFSIVALIFTIRYFVLKIFKISANPLFFIAPRGLITILLFLSIAPDQKIEFVNKSLIIQVIILSSLILMFGLFKGQKQKLNKF